VEQRLEIMTMPDNETDFFGISDYEDEEELEM
jgi:hypothetical protein